MASDLAPPQIDWCKVLTQLRCDPESLSWRERAALLTERAEAFASPSDEMLEVLDLLACDAKWEVRLQVAELLARLPEVPFNRLAAKLTQDQNSYVIKAAERSLDRRRKGQLAASRRQRMLGGVADDYELMEKLHGTLATKMSRQIAERLYDMLVGATIHNMRGLLTPVSSSAQSLLKRVEAGKATPAELKKHLKRIVEATGDLGRLMDEVRRYSQQIPSDRRRERLLPLIADAVDNARACFTKSGHDPDLIELRIAVPDDLTIDASKVHLIVALTNLLQNSFEAFKPVMDSKGPFWIAITAHTDRFGEVAIVIEDNGIGFGAEDLRQIRQFIPGQTTLKHDGTGFGLPTAKRYIETHGGSLEIDSQEGVGTRVSLRLPLTED
jgi:signal transduction histidine kinase